LEFSKTYGGANVSNIPIVKNSVLFLSLAASFVFSGMNGQPEEYNNKVGFMASWTRPGGNVTGVYEKLWVSKSLVVMEEALQGFRSGDKVVGITDYSPTGNAITRQFELEPASVRPTVKWELCRVRDFGEYKKLIQELNGDPSVRAIYPAALQLKTEQGEIYTAKKIFDWTTANGKAPEMALNYFFSHIRVLLCWRLILLRNEIN